MKKYIIIGFSLATALLTLSSCNQSLLDIPKKGVISYESFFDGSEESAESAALNAYAAGIKAINVSDLDFAHWNIAPAHFVLTNAPSDDIYYGSGSESDHIFGLEINEYRKSFGSNSNVIVADYKAFYQFIYACNLVIDNFDPSTSSKVARNVAEARVLRAFAHLHLATFWGNPPKIDHLIEPASHPSNCDHAELLAWIIKEFEEASAALPSRNGKNDKNGAVRLTKEAALAFMGKAQVFAGDYAGAKTTLKKVIDSGNYDLVSGPDMWNMFHRAGDGSPEKVFEFNYVDNVNLNNFGGFRHFQRSQSCFWRDLRKLPMPFFQLNNAWGGGGNPSESFVNAIMANEPNSYRRKAWLISYEELLTDYEYQLGAEETEWQGAKYKVKADKDMTKEEKLLDPRRGVSTANATYFGNIGWFLIKSAPLETELNVNSSDANDNNTPVMRYAEVLLLYAEACAQAGDDGSGLAALNKVATRAGAPTYSSLTLENVKKEKRFEMFMEGVRFPDLVRWGDAATVLKDQYKEIPSFKDPFDPAKNVPHSAVPFISDRRESGDYGFKAGKNEWMPYPLGELQLNAYNEETGEGIKQNPGWD